MSGRAVGVWICCVAVMQMGLATEAPAQQTYPTKTISFVVPFAPGGATDTVARLVAEALQNELKARIIVENKPGASNQVGVQYVLGQPADGHTLLVGTGGLSILRYANPSFTMDLRQELRGIGLFGSSSLVVAISRDTPASDLKQFIDYGKKNPGKLNYGSQGAIDVLGGAALFEALGIEAEIIRYSGGGPVKAALTSNEVQFSMFYGGDLAPLVEAEKARAIATTGLTRHPAYPQLPTIKEVTNADLEIIGWSGLFAKAGTPTSIIDKLNDGLARVLRNEAFSKRLSDLGYNPSPMSAKQFDEFFAGQIAKWAGVAARTKYQPQ